MSMTITMWIKKSGYFLENNDDNFVITKGIGKLEYPYILFKDRFSYKPIGFFKTSDEAKKYHAGLKDGN